MSKTWSSTLRLPKSSLPPRPLLSRRSAFIRQCTDDFYQWQASQPAQSTGQPTGQPSQQGSRPLFTIHDGPPYANGPLHVGHALNKILKDMILRVQVQQGYRVSFLPGWDCHGLPIEHKALEQLASQGKTETNHTNLSPVTIRKIARELANKTLSSQMEGLRSYAVAADWDRRWTTMDKDFEIRQLRLFQSMLESGLIYRRHKPVYWSPSSQTALAESELEYRENHVSRAAYILFPITSDLASILELPSEPLYAAIWTTTPWTVPGNRAIGIHRDLEYCVVRHEEKLVLVAKTRVEALEKAWLGSPKGTPNDMLESNNAKLEIIRDAIPGSLLQDHTYHNQLHPQGENKCLFHADFVSADTGTGLVHLAPGHGMDDYLVCLERGIAAESVVDDAGYFVPEVCSVDHDHFLNAPSIHDGGNDVILDMLRKSDQVVHVHQLRHKYPYDWRSKKPVVIRATVQWFADVQSIKKDALESLGAVKFMPHGSRARLESFVHGRSEWCISRQRAWGVPLPILYWKESGEAISTRASIDHIIRQIEERGMDAWFSDAPDDPRWIAPEVMAQQEALGPIRRGTDTMDVWFDSGSSWGMMNGQQADVYLEGTDQHRGWFQSSLLTRVAALRGQSSNRLDTLPQPTTEQLSPFKTLITHGFTLDENSQKMSKSIGNTITPDQIMDGSLLPPLKLKGKEKQQALDNLGLSDKNKDAPGKSPAPVPPLYDALGPDALRLWVASAEYTKDITISPTVLKSVHSSLKRYRTVLKMLTGSLHPESRLAATPRSLLDKLALVQLYDTLANVGEHYRRYEFMRGVAVLNHWVSVDLSAFYLEALKDRLYCGDGGGVLEPIFIGMLRMLAPITPVLVEEAWDARPDWMKASGDDSNVIPSRHLFASPLTDDHVVANIPRADDTELVQLRLDLPYLQRVHAAVKVALEAARAEKKVGSSLQASVTIVPVEEELRAVVERHREELATLFVVSHVHVAVTGSESSPSSEEWSFEHAIHETDAHTTPSSTSTVDSRTLGFVQVRPPKQHKCERCWRYLAPEPEGLCHRCDITVKR